MKPLATLMIIIALTFSLTACTDMPAERLNHLAASTELTREQTVEYILTAAGQYCEGIRKEDVIYAYPSGSMNERAVSRVETLMMIHRAFGNLPEIESIRQTVDAEFGIYPDVDEWPLVKDAVVDLYNCGVITPEYPAGDGLLHGSDAMTAGELKRLLRYTEALYKPYKIPVSGYSPDDTWAIYWYICGSDLESEQNDASNDIAELLKVELPENITVVIEAGGARTWHNGFDPTALSRLAYTGSTLTFIESAPQASMGDAETLKRFLDFCEDNYPADHKAFIFWDHGGGTVKGICTDENFRNDALSLDEIREAFTGAYPLSGTASPPFELVGFDACLMATVEVADAFKDMAIYLVGSEEAEPDCGWNYTGFMSALARAPHMNGAQLGKFICDSYYDGCEQLKDEEEITLSVIDLGCVSDLLCAYDGLGAEMLIKVSMNTQLFSDFGRAANAAENYGNNDEALGYYNLVDLGDFARRAGRLLPEYGSEVLAALDRCILYTVHGEFRSLATGLSCYYTLDNKKSSYSDIIRTGRSTSNNSSMTPVLIEKSWHSYLTSDAFRYYFNYLFDGVLNEAGIEYVMEIAEMMGFVTDAITADPIRIPDASEIVKTPIDISHDGSFVLELGHEMLEMLCDTHVELSYYNEDSDVFVSLGYDSILTVDYDNGLLTTAFDGYWGSIGGVMCELEVTEESDEYVVYQTPIILNGDLSTVYSLAIGYIYETDEYEILGVRRGMSVGGVSLKYLRILKPGDIITPVHRGYSNLSQIVESVHYARTAEIPYQMLMLPNSNVTISDSTEFNHTKLPNGKYILAFRMTDVRGDSFSSAGVLIEIVRGMVTVKGIVE